MPTFSNDNEIDVEPWEYVSSCNRFEIKELIESLVEDGYLPKSVLNESDDDHHYDLDWKNSCSKLIRGRHLLSQEDEQTILKISEKII